MKKEFSLEYILSETFNYDTSHLVQVEHNIVNKRRMQSRVKKLSFYSVILFIFCLSFYLLFSSNFLLDIANKMDYSEQIISERPFFYIQSIAIRDLFIKLTFLSFIVSFSLIILSPIFFHFKEYDDSIFVYNEHEVKFINERTIKIPLNAINTDFNLSDLKFVISDPSVLQLVDKANERGGFYNYEIQILKNIESIIEEIEQEV